MRLSPHPDSRPPAITVEAWAERRGWDLALRYVVTGDVAALATPARVAGARTDELWKHTCFEAFVQPAGGAGYFEFNFAPSTNWAAYAFHSYRDGMRNAEIGAPRIEIDMDDERYELRASLIVPNDAPWRVALAAVIEDSTSERSYWALAHAAGKPDFHGEAGRVVELGGRRAG